MLIKNKKGSHVDWALSMGIFLVYLIGMFILLRPGVTPVHKPEVLLEILETNFNKEVIWEVREIPLVIKKCNLEGELPCRISVLDDNFKFSNFVCIKGDCTENAVGSSVICDGNEKPNLGEGNVFEAVYYLKDYLQEGVDKKAKPNLIIDYSNGNEDYCLASLGASITKIGVNKDWKDNLDPKLNPGIDYKKLKSDWDFPEDKEFSIWYSEEGEEPYKLIGAEVPQGINVFTKEIKTQKVSTSGEITIPVIVNFRIW